MALNIKSFRALDNTNTAILGNGAGVHAASSRESASRAFSLPSARKAQNNAANRAFLDTIEREYGHAARTAAMELIKDTAKPLTGRVVHNVLEKLKEQFPQTAVTDILDANRALMAPMLLNDHPEVEGSFGHMLAEATAVASAQWNGLRVELGEKERIALKEAIMDEALKGGGSLEQPAFLDTAKLREIALARITECVADSAERAAGVRVRYINAPKSAADAFQNVAAILCERKPDFAEIHCQLGLAGRACRYEAVAIGGKTGSEGAELFETTMNGYIDQLAGGLSDWQLQRLDRHLANTALQEKLDDVFLEARKFDTSIVSSMACHDCGGASLVAEKLAIAVARACKERGLETTASYTAEIQSASARELAQSALQSARAHVGAGMRGILREIASCRSDTDADAVTAALIKLRTDCLGPAPRAREMQKFEALFHESLNEQVRNMSNMQLLELFKGVCSTGVMHARIVLVKESTALGSSLLGDFNELEGLVNLEIADRVCAGATVINDNDGISPATLKILADAERVAMQRNLNIQSDEYLLAGAGQRKELSDEAAMHLSAGTAPGSAPLTADEFAQTLREADLTININPRIFFGSEVPNTEVKNFFQLNVDKGAHYGERRLFTEQQQFRGIADLDRQTGEVRGEFHPVSAALNVGRNTLGAAFMYGMEGFIVLRDDVKQTRTTFTPRDSFHCFHQDVTQEKVDSLAGALRATIAGLPAPYDGCVIPDSVIDRYTDALQAQVGKRFGLRTGLQIEQTYSIELSEVTDASGQPLSNADQEQLSAFFDVCVIKHFASAATQDNPIATYETMAHLLEGADEAVVKGVRDIRDNPDILNADAGNYVEAQIHGGVDLRHDVKAIHFLDPDTATPEGRAMLARAQKFCREYGISLHIGSLSEHGEHSASNLYTVTQLFPDSGVPVDPSFAEFKKELPAIFEMYKQHEVEFDPTDIHGRGHISRAIIYGKALSGVFKEAGMSVDEYALFRAIAFHDSGRRANGTDVFEADSAGNMRNYLAEHGITNEAYLRASAGLIDRGEDGQATLEGIILQSSDSLDIIRVCGKEQYNRSLLGFMKQTTTRDGRFLDRSPRLVEKLIDEVDRFITLTSPEIEPPFPEPEESHEEFVARREAFERDLKAQRQAEPNEGYFERNFEAVLMAHKDDFPTLYKYYTL